MTEIRIERKQNNWWGWVLGLLALILVGWLAFSVLDDDDDGNDTAMEEQTLPVVPVRAEDPHDGDLVMANPMVDVKGIDMGNFDVKWDGSKSSADENVLYYLNSLNFMDTQMGRDHDFSNVAFRALANSLIVVTSEQALSDDVNLKNKIELMRQNANKITQDWRSPNHADLIKQAALAATDVMEQIQKARYPDLQQGVQEVRQNANKIQPGTLTLEQRQNVKSFFRSAGDALEEMRNL